SLLTLPLLFALFGYALARPHSSVRECYNGRCFMCVIGGNALKVSKGEITDQSSSINCVSNNDHQRCTVCTNGACHTTTNGKREICIRGYRKDGSCIGLFDIEKRQTGSSRNSYTTCNTDKYGDRKCKICKNGGCEYTTDKNKRAASVEDQNNKNNNNNAQFVNNIQYHKRKRSASDYPRNCETNKYGKRTCYICSETGCFTTEDTSKRSASVEDQNNNNAESANNIQYRRLRI
ncbi:hypothetical protein PMAYCL1PPCAC_01121, partial [Pristionchus mayeri]